MGTITAKAIVVNVAASLNDSGGVRWSKEELLAWLNDGQREIGIYRPDAITVVEAVLMMAGSMQTLPAAGIRLIDALYNAGAAGTTQGKTVRVVERDQLDTFAGSSWRSTAPADDVEHVVFDGRYPTSYQVYPPQNAGPRYLMVAYQKAPADCTINGVGAGVSDSVITLNDVYQTALDDYIKHRAYQKDSDTRDTSKAAMHYQWFLSRLGLKTQTDKTNDVNRNAPPAQQSRQPGGVSQRAQSF